MCLRCRGAFLLLEKSADSATLHLKKKKKNSVLNLCFEFVFLLQHGSNLILPGNLQPSRRPQCDSQDKKPHDGWRDVVPASRCVSL